ncbi:MAG: ABC transporter ATP-binding protein [Bacteroidetes bacterium]|nr:MAG: ABC transporter ATP-binding protein [Bacteroidota bacterium]
MLSIQNLSFYFGSRPLYENINLHIKPKDRIGFIGANGAGKSTLLRIIVGEYAPDAGNISKAKDCTIGFLNQDLLSYQTDNSILSVALEAFEEANLIQRQIDEVIHKLETDYSDNLVEKLTNLQARLEAIGGYTLEADAEKILEGLGFSTEDLQKPLRKFSGGWRMRVMLAKMLLQKPSLLLLDEPTNHLDLPSIQWLEEYLNSYEGAIVIVTHDREFLQNTANIIVEITNRQLHYYAGDYEFYVEEKIQRREIHKASYENQQAQIRQTERFIDRFRAKASKARQVQSRVKALERMDKIEDVIDENAKVHFRFNFGQASGKIVTELKNVSKSYGENIILRNSVGVIERGDKIALIGANGRGKSTLLRIIDGSEAVEGSVEMGYNVRDAFFAQHQLESLNLDNEILTELKQAGSNKTETELRTILGCFLFNGEDAFKKIKVLSGGEKSRVALAKVLLSEANFLLLDEPTNHLDMQSVNILIQALTQYEGTFVVISHDRHFVANIANKIWYIEDYELKEFLGTYDEYEYWRMKRAEDEKANAQTQAKNEPKKEKEKSNAQTTPSPDAEREKQLKKMNKQLETIEQEIVQLEKEARQKEEALASPDVYEDAKKMETATKAFALAKEKLAQKQAEWDNLAVEIDKY